MSEKISKFDIARYLDNADDIQLFLSETAKCGDASDFVHALGVAARAKGMTEVAKQAGLTRASLYKSLSDDSNPHFETIFRVCHALGVRLTIEPSA